MYRKLNTVFVFVTILAVLLAACGGAPQATTVAPPEPAETTDRKSVV